MGAIRPWPRPTASSAARAASSTSSGRGSASGVDHARAPDGRRVIGGAPHRRSPPHQTFFLLVRTSRCWTRWEDSQAPASFHGGDACSLSPSCRSARERSHHRLTVRQIAVGDAAEEEKAGVTTPASTRIPLHSQVVVEGKGFEAPEPPSSSNLVPPPPPQAAPSGIPCPPASTAPPSTASTDGSPSASAPPADESREQEQEQACDLLITDPAPEPTQQDQEKPTEQSGEASA